MFKEWLAWRDKKPEVQEEEEQDFGSCAPVYAEDIESKERPTPKGGMKPY